MELNLMQAATVYSALKRYLPYCQSCLSNPENKSQRVFIEGDIKIAADLMAQLKSELEASGISASRF